MAKLSFQVPQSIRDWLLAESSQKGVSRSELVVSVLEAFRNERAPDPSDLDAEEIYGGFYHHFLDLRSLLIEFQSQEFSDTELEETMVKMSLTVPDTLKLWLKEYSTQMAQSLSEAGNEILKDYIARESESRAGRPVKTAQENAQEALQDMTKLLKSLSNTPFE